jgi:Fe-S-cluster formation regulator IscX/YfhJ
VCDLDVPDYHQISSANHSLDPYRCNVNDMQDVIKRLTDLLDDPNQFRSDLAYLDSFAKGPTHVTEHTNFHKFAAKLIPHNTLPIPVKVHLQADGLLQLLDNRAISVQYKSGPVVPLYNTREVENGPPIIRHYDTDDFQLLVIHLTDDKHYFVPIKVLIQYNFIGPTRTTDRPTVSFQEDQPGMLRRMEPFLIDFRSNNWKTKLMNIINNPYYEIKPLADTHSLVKAILPGYKHRLTEDYAKLAASFSELHRGLKQIDSTNYESLNLFYPNANITKAIN